MDQFANLRDDGRTSRFVPNPVIGRRSLFARAAVDSAGPDPLLCRYQDGESPEMWEKDS